MKKSPAFGLALVILGAAGMALAETIAPPTGLVTSRVVVQVGIVVKDIEKAARAYAEVLGVEPPKWELTDPVELSHTQYLGRASKAQAKLAFIQMDNIVLELIEPVGGPSTWRAFLETRGEGVHHLALEVQGMNERIAGFDEKGIPLVQRGDYTGGRYAYLDGTARLGIILELLENFPEKK